MLRFTLALLLATTTAAIASAQSLEGKIEGRSYVSPTGMFKVVIPVLPELGIYRPIEDPKRVDFDQARLYDHPIFAGIDQKTLETNHGVAGFYGRGHNPPPEGAIVINALGPRQVPVDWIWARPKGGEILSHAGNEFWGCGDDPEAKKLLARRAAAWLCGELN